MPSIPADWLAAGGVVVVVFGAGIAAVLRAQKELVTRAECRLTHDGFDKELEHRRNRSHETSNALQGVILRLSKAEASLADLRTNMRWQNAALGSLMKKLGANGVPPPPEE